MILDLAIVVAVAFVTSFVVCWAMIWIGPRDEPDEDRKKHRPATPTSGGIGIGAGYGLAMIVLSYFSFEWRRQIAPESVGLFWTAALFAYPLLIVGFVDDVRRLRARFKFVIYMVLAFAAASLMGFVGEVRIGALDIHLPLIVGLSGTALWVFTLINVVNFMDGANGMAMGSVAAGLTTLSLILIERGAVGDAAVTLACAAALLGFLVWNFPSGRLFAGDSGALFAGAIAAFGCLIAIARADMPPIVAPILFFPLLADVLLTLADRIRRRRSLFIGHTEHMYQIAIMWGWSHARISVTYWLAMAVCGAAAIAASRDETAVAPAVVLAALMVFAIVLDIVVRRRASEAGLLKH